MPFKSEAQRRFFHAAKARGEIEPGVVKEWERHTPKDEKLPERVRSKEAARAYGFCDELEKIALTTAMYPPPAALRLLNRAAARSAPNLRRASAPALHQERTALERAVARTNRDAMGKAAGEGMEKAALAAWKRVLRAGQLGAEDVSRLLQHGVLDYGKETRGIHRGLQGLAERHGVDRLQPSVRELGGELGKKLMGQPSRAKEVGEQLRLARMGEGYMSGVRPVTINVGGAPLVVGHRPVTIEAPSVSPMLRDVGGQSRESLDALLRSHEMDEAVIKGQALSRTGSLGKDWVVEKPVEGLKERVEGAYLHRMRPQIAQLAEEGVALGPFSSSALLRALPKKKGHVVRGVHQSPEVLMRESTRLATLPPEVRERMLKLRTGEVETLSPFGFVYGQTPTPGTRKRILKAFEAGEI